MNSIPPKRPRYKYDGSGEKPCTICEKVKKITEFTYELNSHPLSSQNARYSSACRQCRNEKSKQKYDYRKQRNTHLSRTYGMTLVQYEAMHEAQGGVCACCGGVEKYHPGRYKRTEVETMPLMVDHDHVTGLVRALLCTPCNQAVGLLNEEPERALQLYHYMVRIKE